MKLSIWIKSRLASFLYRNGQMALKLDARSGNDIVILTYHRVLPKNEITEWIQPGMYVEPKTLEMHLRFLQNHFNIVRIKDIITLRENNNIPVNGRPLCVLTFDDGWHDFYIHAFPILKAYGAYATIFLPTDFIGTGKWFWSDRLSYLLYQNRHTERANTGIGRKVSSLGQVFEKVFSAGNANPDNVITKIKRYRQDEIEDELSAIATKLNFSPSPPGRAFLSWPEVKELADSGIITVGSHTATHRILTTLNEDEIQDELLISGERLIEEKLIDPSLVPFCYPNGDHNSGITALVKDSGYILAVTAEKGWNYLGKNLFTLKRIGMHQDVSRTQSLFACRIYGMLL